MTIDHCPFTKTYTVVVPRWAVEEEFCPPFFPQPLKGRLVGGSIVVITKSNYNINNAP